MLKQKKLTLMTSSSTVFRVVSALIAVTTMDVQPTSVEATGLEPWLPEEWTAKVETITVAPVPAITRPLWWLGEMTNRGRGIPYSVTSTKRPPMRFCDCRGRKHGKHGHGRKHGKHGRGRKHGKHGGRKHMKHGHDGSKGPRPNKGHRKESYVDNKLVFVNVEAGRTLNIMPISSPTPVLTMKVSETDVQREGAAAAVDRLLYSIGTTNAIWSVVLISWAIALAIIYRGWCSSARTSRLCVPELATELQTVIAMNPTAELKSANTVGPLIDLEPESKLKS